MKTLLTLIAASAFLTFTTISEVPENWLKRGSNPLGYSMTIDKTTFASGHSSALIASTAKKTKGFGTLMQIVDAEKFKGKTIKMKGLIKTADVKKWCGFWLRIDNAKGRTLGFNNMQKKEG